MNSSAPTRIARPASGAKRPHPAPSALLFAAALTATLAAAPTSAVEYARVDAAKSSLVFVSKQMGVAVDGRFKRFQVDLRFDPAKPAAGKADFRLELASIDTGVREADEEVVGKDWFDVARHPQARFVSREVKALGGGRFEALGDLTIKGATRAVRAPFTFKESAGRAVFEGGLTILRGDFAVGSGAWADYGTVANEVELRFRIEATP